MPTLRPLKSTRPTFSSWAKSQLEEKLYHSKSVSQTTKSTSTSCLIIAANRKFQSTSALSVKLLKLNSSPLKEPGTTQNKNLTSIIAMLDLRTMKTPKSVSFLKKDMPLEPTTPSESSELTRLDKMMKPIRNFSWKSVPSFKRTNLPNLKENFTTNSKNSESWDKKSESNNSVIKPVKLWLHSQAFKLEKMLWKTSTLILKLPPPELLFWDNSPQNKTSWLSLEVWKETSLKIKLKPHLKNTGRLSIVQSTQARNQELLTLLPPFLTNKDLSLLWVITNTIKTW